MSHIAGPLAILTTAVGITIGIGCAYLQDRQRLGFTRKFKRYAAALICMALPYYYVLWYTGALHRIIKGISKWF